MRIGLRIGSSEAQRLEYVNVSGDNHLNIGRQRATDGVHLDGVIDFVFLRLLIKPDTFS
jgi:hypothetical protein